MLSELDIPLHGPLVNILREVKSELSSVLQSKFGFEVTISDVEFEDNPGFAQQRRPTVDAEKRFEVVLPSGILVSVWKADLTEFSADAVVNAANDKLQHTGGLAYALSKAGGPQIQAESDKYIYMHGGLSTGDAVVTNPGLLPCKKIIHAVGPRVSSHSDLSKPKLLLKKAIWSILARAKENKLKTVAIPAISSGLFGYPLPQCADTIVTTVVESCEYRSGSCPKEIHLVNIDGPTVKEMERACHQILSRYLPKKGAASKSRGGSVTSERTSEEQMRYLQQNASHLSISHVSRDNFHGSGAPSAKIAVFGPTDDITREAKEWLQGLLKSHGSVLIRNNFILHLGEQQRPLLSQIMHAMGVSIKEHFERGRASIIVSGDSREGVIVAALQVELMLCNTQTEFVSEEESAMFGMTAERASFWRKTVDPFTPELSDREGAFMRVGLRVVKVDRVENTTLKLLFDRKKQQLDCFTPRKMFQHIPAQFCDMVYRTGFQAEYAPPDDPAFGVGIYFAGTVEKAMEMWKESNQEYLHFVEAEVLTGSSIHGHPGLILPPAQDINPLIRYNSVNGGPDISVIFSGYQALPKYIITCKSFHSD